MQESRSSDLTLQSVDDPIPQDLESNKNEIKQDLGMHHRMRFVLIFVGVFEKYLSIWVALCIASGLLLGYYVPAIPQALNRAVVAQVSIPIAILLWAMILPMMIQIDFSSLKNVWSQPKALIMTTGINYLVQPFTMTAFAILFLKVIFVGYIGQELANAYTIGLIILGGSPCTAMVFVWSALMNGDPSYTLTQVALNDIVLLFAYVPLVKLLAGTSSVSVPWDTLLYSVAFFVLVPLLLGILIRWIILRSRGLDYLQKRILPATKPFSIAALLATLVLIFIYQATTVISNLVHILVIAIPILIQTIFIWGLTFIIALWLKLPYEIAGPATLIASSNFFELAVAVSISIYGRVLFFRASHIV